MWAHSWHSFVLPTGMNGRYVNKRRSKGPGVEFKLRDMSHVYVFHVNIGKCSFPTHMPRSAFTRPSNKIFIPFKERILYGVISPSKFKVCFRCSSLSFNLVLHHATFEFYNSTLLLEMRHWSFTMRHRTSDIQHSRLKFIIQHSSLKLNFTDEWLTF